MCDHLLREVVCGERTRLRPMSLEDTKSIVAWRNDPENARWFMSVTPLTPESHEAWLSGRLDSGRDFNWVIEDATGRTIGAIAIYNIDWGSRTAEFGRLIIGELEAKGKGYGSESVRLILGVARKAGITKLLLDVKSDNERAVRLYIKSGFKNISEYDGVAHMELIMDDRPGEPV